MNKMVFGKYINNNSFLTKLLDTLIFNFGLSGLNLICTIDPLGNFLAIKKPKIQSNVCTIKYMVVIITSQRHNLDKKLTCDKVIIPSPEPF